MIKRDRQIGPVSAPRTREEITREIKLALAIGVTPLLDERRERTRGVNPYDSDSGTGKNAPRDVWGPHRRG